LVSPVVSFLLAFQPLSYMRSSSPPFVLHAPPIHPSWLDYSNYTWRRVQLMNFLIMQFSPTSCLFIPLPDELENINFNQYMIGYSFCRQIRSHGEVCVLIQKNFQFDSINLYQYNKEKDIETCALKFKFVKKCHHYLYI
jgi:hypothetical protein